ncbi:MAG: VTT domain-containing protein [bacterium]
MSEEPGDRNTDLPDIEGNTLTSAPGAATPVPAPHEPLPPDDEPDPIPVELEIEAAESAGKSEKKILVMALVVIACIALIHFTPLKALTSDVAWKAHIHQLGIWASSIYFVVSVILIAIGIPRMFLCWLAGVLFGFTTGVIIGQFSALFGSYATFVFSRWGGREWVRKRIENSQRLRAMLKKPSTFTIFLVRQLPIAGIVPNLILGLTPVKHRYFLLGSFLGYLPSSIMVAIIGSSFGKGFDKETLQHSVAQITAAMLGLGAMSLIVWYLRKRIISTAR